MNIETLYSIASSILFSMTKSTECSSRKLSHSQSNRDVLEGIDTIRTISLEGHNSRLSVPACLGLAKSRELLSATFQSTENWVCRSRLHREKGYGPRHRVLVPTRWRVASRTPAMSKSLVDRQCAQCFRHRRCNFVDRLLCCVTPSIPRDLHCA
jgi:hypothetical protein